MHDRFIPVSEIERHIFSSSVFRVDGKELSLYQVVDSRAVRTLAPVWWVFLFPLMQPTYFYLPRRKVMYMSAQLHIGNDEPSRDSSFKIKSNTSLSSNQTMSPRPSWLTSGGQAFPEKGRHFGGVRLWWISSTSSS